MTQATPTWIAAISLIVCVTAAAQIAPPQVPENLKVPATEDVLLKALGKGKQICVFSAKPGQQLGAVATPSFANRGSLVIDLAYGKETQT